jgi:hypothetical protein
MCCRATASDALAPDEFVLQLVHQDLDAVVEVVEGQTADLRHPPMSTTELLDVATLLSGAA